MTRSTAVLWLLTSGVAAAAMVRTGTLATSARSDAVRAQAQLQDLHSKAGELAKLESAIRTAPARPTAGSGLAARLTAALSAARLPTSALTGVSPEAATTLTAQDDSGLKRQRASVNLGGLTLPQVGGFLAAWRAAEPGWTVTRIDLSPLTGPASSSAVAAGGDLPLRIGLGLEALLDPEPMMETKP